MSYVSFFSLLIIDSAVSKLFSFTARFARILGIIIRWKCSLHLTSLMERERKLPRAIKHRFAWKTIYVLRDRRHVMHAPITAIKVRGGNVIKTFFSAPVCVLSYTSQRVNPLLTHKYFMSSMLILFVTFTLSFFCSFLQEFLSDVMTSTNITLIVSGSI